MSIIKEKKYAVVISGKTITEYIYDDVTQMFTSILAVQKENNQVRAVHAYDKETGKILFKKENIKLVMDMDSCYIMKLCDNRVYVYFDLDQKIRGPYNNFSANRDKGIIVLQKDECHNSKNPVSKYGAYYTDRENGLLLPIKYEQIELQLENIIPIVYKGKVGIADYDGDIMFEPKYDGIDSYFDNQILDLYSNKEATSTLIDETGDIICKLDTKFSIDANEKLKLLFVENDGKYGIYDDEGIEIFPISLNDYCIEKDVVEVRIGNQSLAYIPAIDDVVSTEGYKYTMFGKLKYFDGRRWRTVEKE